MVRRNKRDRQRIPSLNRPSPAGGTSEPAREPPQTDPGSRIRPCDKLALGGQERAESFWRRECRPRRIGAIPKRAGTRTASSTPGRMLLGCQADGGPPAAATDDCSATPWATAGPRERPGASHGVGHLTWPGLGLLLGRPSPPAGTRWARRYRTEPNHEDRTVCLATTFQSLPPIRWCQATVCPLPRRQARRPA